ncbi:MULTISPECIES: hypothetical protein [unclassified Caballeronia]|uniref:hypothetical protein n=1 Tax=unclassified Caballeronia TaxID=2646786 RepID=UPI0013E9B8BA|nr:MULTISPECIES: hypothetical protein [unclassified Caballeronia]
MQITNPESTNPALPPTANARTHPDQTRPPARANPPIEPYINGIISENFIAIFILIILLKEE